MLRKRWLVILLLAVLGAGAAATVSVLTTPRYEASTLVFVYVQSAGTVGELAQGSSFAQSQVKSYAEAVSTPRVLDSVIKRLGLSVTADELSKYVKASAPLDTVNIEITVSDTSPGQAADIANAVTSSFREVIAAITKPTSGESQVSVSVLRNATVPDRPVSPNIELNLALGLLVGLALGVGLGVLLEVLDTRVRTARDVEAITKTPIVGRIAYDKDAERRPLIVQDDPRSPRAEAFRTMRTNLQFLDIEPGGRSFVITSSIPNEGKTTTAANTAIALSDAGAKVVIIDADLRRPKLAEYLGIEGAIGLSDVLISRVSLEDALQPWGTGDLMVLPAGTIPPNPSELLGSQAMVALLRLLEKEFDVVILDLPPLLPVTDAAVVSRHARGALVVVAAGRTHKGEFSAAIAMLQSVGAPVAGIIMTFLPVKGSGSYGYGYRNYNYAREVVQLEMGEHDHGVKAAHVDLDDEPVRRRWGRNKPQVY
jgi:capsular exopolysaccharide synthesis family protein